MKRKDLCKQNIDRFQIRSAQFVTSYPVPPHTYFQSSPCSTCIKATVSKAATRHTYAATSSAPISSEPLQRPAILHFAEPLKQTDSTPPIQHKHVLSPDDGRIFSLNVLPQVGGESHEAVEHDVLAVKENGNLLCLDETLGRIQWQKRWTDITNSPKDNVSQRIVEFSELVDISHARQGILRGREDIIAKLGVAGNEVEEIPGNLLVLVLVVSQQNTSGKGRSRLLHLLSTEQYSVHGLTSSTPPIRHLLSHDLDSSEEGSAKHTDGTATYSLDASLGVLHQLLDGVITTFDFTGLLPRRVFVLSQPDASFISFLRLSPSRLLTATTSSCSVHDIRYNTVQASQPLEEPTASSTGSKKRKRSPDAITQFLSLVLFLPSAGLAVGLRGNDVLGLRLQGRHRSNDRAGNPKTLLIDVLGRGTRQRLSKTKATTKHNLPDFLSRTHQEADHYDPTTWEGERDVIEKAFANHDIATFEDLFASAVGINLPTPTGSSTSNPKTTNVNGLQNAPKVNGIHNSSSDTGKPDRTSSAISTFQYTWPSELLLAAQPQRVRHQAIYALGKMFGWATSESNISKDEVSDSLEIKFFPPNVFRWLVFNNFLTAETVSQALLRQSSTGSVLRPVAPPNIASALLKADPSTQALFTLITESSYLDISILVRTIDIYVQSHSNQPVSQADPKALPAPPSMLNGDSVDVNMQNDEDSDIDALMMRADEDISRAESILNDTFELRTIGLKHALIKLYAFPREQVTQLLRQELSVHDLRFLIHILRIELQDGGWVSRYFDAGPSNLQSVEEEGEDEEDDRYVRSPSDSAITLVSSLLSCCVDAIGIGGWLTSSTQNDHSPSLTGTSDDLDPHELIRMMHTETFAVLEGLHEVNFIGNTVDDFLRYAERVRSAQPLPNVSQRNKKALRDGGVTRPYTLHTGNEGWEDIAARLKAALPVGGKIPEEERRIQGTKIGPGGEVRTKSRRELGMEMSKKVGRYSFERIRV